jgi:NADPH:quinone reductase-like Zn-dependent oxidoreductase
MIAAVLYGKENLQIESVSVPKIENGDVLVRVRCADLRHRREGVPPRLPRPHDRSPGAVRA